MGINIINQTNEQECGVCVLTALHNHFYGESLGKEQVLDKSNILDSGMTLFDFENLGSKLGIECESYEVKFSEFNSLKINGYFVLLVMTKNGSGNHFVIARKKKKYIEIYDSCSLKMNTISYNELKQIFLNVVILVKKKPNKIFQATFSKASSILMFDLRFVLLNLGLSILILLASIGCASFLNFIIDFVIDKSSINNLITICFIFAICYFANDILTYVSNLYMSQHVKNYFLLFTNKILTSLKSKKLDFLNKVDKNWIFKTDECVFNLSNFIVVEINKFISNIVFLVACICIIGCIQYYLLIFVVVYAVIELIFFLFAYRKKKEVFLEIVRSENNNANLYKQLITSLSNEVWLRKRQNLIRKIKSNYSSIYKNYSDVILFKNNTTLFKSILKSICEIFLIATMAYLIIKTDKLSIGKLTFAISAFALYRNSASDLFSYILAKVEFNVYWQVYKDLTTVSNLSIFDNIVLKQKIKTICFKSNTQVINLNTRDKFHDLNEPIIELLKNNNEILLNNQKINFSQNFVDSVIVVDQNSDANVEIILKDIQDNPRVYSQYLQFFNLDLNKGKQSFYERIIINLLCLLSEKNKIIFIDDIFKFIKKKDRLVVKQLISKTKRKNSVFVLGKEEND